jgi:hypothetical protein
VIFGFMDAEKASFPVSFMAERLGVSTSGFYEWRQRQQSPCERRIVDAGLAETIVEIWRQSRGTYGSPRIWAELRLGLGIRVSRKRVARLMRQEGIEGVYRRRSRGAPAATRPPFPMRIWSTASSPSMDRTGCGSLTSPNIGPARATCSWRRSSMRGPGG